MQNTFTDAPDQPVGKCTSGGCEKWPELDPAPCCWLSCRNLCGAACLKHDGSYGEMCIHFGGARDE